MKNDGVYSVLSDDSELNVPEGFRWLWDSDESETRKRKKRKKKKKKKIKKMEKTINRLLEDKKKSKKKTRKKSKKQLQREFRYRLIEKSADTTLNTFCDITRMYAKSKFLPSGSGE